MATRSTPRPFAVFRLKFRFLPKFHVEMLPGENCALLANSGINNRSVDVSGINSGKLSIYGIFYGRRVHFTASNVKISENYKISEIRSFRFDLR